jgi:hypothetical protein
MRSWANIVMASCSSALWLSMVTAAQGNESCEVLRAELAQTPMIIGSRPNARLYAGSIIRQNFEIRKVLQNMQKLGCSSSVSVLDASGHDICQDMQSSLAAMQANKQQMTEQRAAADSQGEVNPRRQELVAALQDNGCDQDDAGQPAFSETRRPFEAPIYPDYSGSSTVPSTELRGSFSLPSGQSGYRTLCVRTCDGAFFPISPSSPPANFRRDAAQCQRMCPGTETELYYSRLSEEAEDMVSTITGQPYRESPNAFAYRNRPSGQKGQCGCNPAGNAQSSAAKNASSVINVTTNPEQTSTEKPLSAPQFQPTIKPESSPKADQLRPYDASSANVRQVGPTFFPTDKPIDLKHPAQDGSQPAQ